MKVQVNEGSIVSYDNDGNPVDVKDGGETVLVSEEQGQRLVLQTEARKVGEFETADDRIRVADPKRPTEVNEEETNKAVGEDPKTGLPSGPETNPDAATVDQGENRTEKLPTAKRS